MKTAEINHIVDRAYELLDVLNNISLSMHRDICANFAEEEERAHRRGKPFGVYIPRGATVQQAGRLFTVKRIAEELISNRPITIADVIHMQPSAVYAASLVANYRARIVAAWSKLPLMTLVMKLDYVEWINDGRKPE